MTSIESNAEHQSKLIADVHALWKTLPIPDWTAPTKEPTGPEDEDVELSRCLAGRSYEAAQGVDHCSSESVFIWCRPDVATYYLGGYLLNAIEDLSDPLGCRGDMWIINLNSFLNIESLYDEVYSHIVHTTPAAIPIVGRYGELLELYRQAGPPEDWIKDDPWPEEPELIERIRAVWRDTDSFRKALEALKSPAVAEGAEAAGVRTARFRCELRVVIAAVLRMRGRPRRSATNN